MPERTISEIFAGARRPLLSYEFFPPKDAEGFHALEKVAQALTVTHPDFVTVTFGAGGSTRERTMQACLLLRDAGYGPVVHHLTCVGSNRKDLEGLIDTIHQNELRNVMALRGDPPKGEVQFRPQLGGLAHAVDLVRFIKKRHPDMCCGVAGYPETHQEALSPESDILYLKDKCDAGGAFVVTQLFYENRVYFDFVKKCRDWGIRTPILPGLLPPYSLAQLRRMAAMCRSTLPPSLVHTMESAGSDPAKVEEAGLAWTVSQIKELLAYGAPGIHLYILNRSKAALAPALKECFTR